MACRKARNVMAQTITKPVEKVQQVKKEETVKKEERLLFGVETSVSCYNQSIVT